MGFQEGITICLAQIYELQNEHNLKHLKQMDIRIILDNDVETAEIVSEEVIINTLEDALELLGNFYKQEFEKLIINEKNITPDFQT